MPEDQRLYKWFRHMGAGVAATAPPNSLDPETGSGFAWRDANNMIERDGQLAPRPGIAPFSTIGTSPTYGLSGTLVDDESPIFLASQKNQEFGNFYAVVTTRQIFVHPSTATGWLNCTPTYTTGTVTATNGSASVTGAGTLWVTRGVTAGQHIKIDGEWYRVSAVGGEGSITMTETFRGATAGGKSYTLLRNWQGGATTTLLGKGRIFAAIYNEALYVAGTYLGSADGATPRPTVIKVSDIYSASPTTSYLTSSFELVAGLDFDNSLFSISGVKALQDGRVVLAANFSEIYYSSNLNDAVWTTSPGGISAITLVDGNLTALGQHGSALTLHYPAGIVLAYPTNQADPPLAYQRSGASMGCWAPMTLRGDGKREFYLGYDKNAWMFDGSTSTQLGDDLGKLMVGVTGSVDFTRNELTYANFHAALDVGRDQYIVFVNGTFGAVLGTRFYVYEIGKRRWWPNTVGVPITAAADVLVTATAVWRDRMLLGSWSMDGASETSILRLMSERLSDTRYTNGDLTIYYVESDDLDFGLPTQKKTIEKILLWLQGIAAGSDAPILGISPDGGVTWTEATLSITHGANLDQQTWKQASFQDRVAGADKWRVRLTWGTGARPNSIPTQMLVVAHRGAEIEQAGA